MFKGKQIIKRSPEELLNYVIEERVINGQVVKVKVYPSAADKYIEHWRTKTEAGPTIKGRGGDK